MNLIVVIINAIMLSSLIAYTGCMLAQSWDKGNRTSEDKLSIFLCFVAIGIYIFFLVAVPYILL